MNRWPAFVAAPFAVVAPAAYGTVYMSIEQAQHAIFPGAGFTANPLSLSAEQRKAIQQRADGKIQSTDLKAWKVSDGGWFLVDQVLGKHELITYAVGINANGSVRGIEILEYLEAYGYQIRDAAWRNQFAGKTATDRLKLDQDIRNISGATLSCRHVTDGVKRLLATYEIAVRQH